MNKNRQVMWDNLKEGDRVIYYAGPEVKKAIIQDKKKTGNMVYIITEDGEFIWTDIYHLTPEEESYYINNLGEKSIKDIDYIFLKYNIQNIFQLIDLIET